MNVLDHLGTDELHLVCYPDPMLRRPARPVERFDDPRLAVVAERMFRIMYDARGVGLAAPQIGVSLRMFVFNPSSEPGGGEGVCINPELLGRDGEEAAEEGCLSLPGVNCRIVRAARVTITAQDLSGQRAEIRAEGLAARIIQHEMDHLDGLLLVDRMTPAGRLANRQALRDLEAV